MQTSQTRNGNAINTQNMKLIYLKEATQSKSSVISPISPRRNPPRAARPGRQIVLAPHSSKMGLLDGSLKQFSAVPRDIDQSLDYVLYGPPIGPRGPWTRLKARQQREAMREFDADADCPIVPKVPIESTEAGGGVRNARGENRLRTSARLAARQLPATTSYGKVCSGRKVEAEGTVACK
jgi:hypothetical protein